MVERVLRKDRFVLAELDRTVKVRVAEGMSNASSALKASAVAARKKDFGSAALHASIANVCYERCDALMSLVTEFRAIVEGRK
jgi:CYTH domain-containing protein